MCFRQLCNALLRRFKERTPLVQTEVFACFADLLRGAHQTASTTAQSQSASGSGSASGKSSASGSSNGSTSAALPAVASPPSLTRQRSAAAMSLQLAQHTDRIVKEVRVRVCECARLMYMRF